MPHEKIHNPDSFIVNTTINYETYELFIIIPSSETSEKQLQQALAYNRKKLVELEQEIIKRYQAKALNKKIDFRQPVYNALIAHYLIATIIPILNGKGVSENFSQLETMSADKRIEALLTTGEKKALKLIPTKKAPPESVNSLFALSIITIIIVMIFSFLVL